MAEKQNMAQRPVLEEECDKAHPNADVEQQLSARGTIKAKINSKEAVENGKVTIHCEFKDDEEDELLGDISAALGDCIESVTSRIYPVSDSDLRETLYRKTGEKHQDNDKVSIYNDEKSGIVLVGDKDIVNQICKSLRQTLDDHQKKKREIILEHKLNAFLLEKLRFAEVFKENTGISIHIDLDYGKVVIDKASTSEYRKCADDVETFLKTVVTTECILSPSLVTVLSATATMEYIQRKLYQDNIKCHIVAKNQTTVIFYTCIPVDGTAALSVVSTSIQTIKIAKSFLKSEEFRTFQNISEGKFCYSECDNELCEITATNDVIVALLVAVEKLDLKSRALEESLIGTDVSNPTCQKDSKQENEDQIFYQIKDDTIENKSVDFGNESDITDDSAITIREEDFFALKYFLRKENWFKKVQDNIKWRDGRMFISLESKSPDSDAIYDKLNVKVNHIREMSRAEMHLESETDIQEIKCKLPDLQKMNDNVFFHIKDTLRLSYLGESYEAIQSAKHYVALSIGQIKESRARRHRRFATHTYSTTENVLADTTDKCVSSRNLSVSTSVHPSKEQEISKLLKTEEICLSDAKEEAITSEFPLKLPSSEKPGKTEIMQTQEGLLIKVYQASILHLDVECIGNAANESLAHGGGIADVIARAAGYDLDKESRDYIRRYGQVPVGQCCVTTAGNLHYKCVVHIVGPRWHAYNDKTQCRDDLSGAVKEALKKAESLKIKSIALPSISAGIFGVPRDICALEYFRAVDAFSRQFVTANSHLKEVHFVDKDGNMSALIEKTFGDCLRQKGVQISPSPHKLSMTTMDKSRPGRADDDKSFSHSLSKVTSKSSAVGPDDHLVFDLNGRFRLIIHKGNITDITHVDAIVCPEDRDFTGQGMIAKVLLEKGGSRYRKRRQRLQKRPYKTVGTMDVEGVIYSFKRVLFVWPPRWDLEFSKNQPKFETDLEETMRNILARADENNLHSVAIPFLGSGPNPESVPVGSCCRCMVTTVADFCKRNGSKSALKDVWFALSDYAAFYYMKSECENKFGFATNP